MITKEQFALYCAPERVDGFFEPMCEAMEAAEINTPNRIRAFLATAAHESGRFRHMVEDLNYSADTLLRTWPGRFDEAKARAMERNPQAIANYVYANREGNGNEQSGDGWRFRGRGFGITFRNNYRWIGEKMCGDAGALLRDPDALSESGDYACMAFALYWGLRELNIPADAGNFDGVSDLFNRGRMTVSIGDSIGWPDRLALYNLGEGVFA